MGATWANNSSTGKVRIASVAYTCLPQVAGLPSEVGGVPKLQCKGISDALTARLFCGFVVIVGGVDVVVGVALWYAVQCCVVLCSSVSRCVLLCCAVLAYMML